MNAKLFFTILICALGIEARAQSNPKEYRNLAAMHIWIHNCEMAQKCYNIYRDLSGESLEKLDVLIETICLNRNSDKYEISFDHYMLMKSLEESNISDKELVLRVLLMYSDPDERVRQIRNIANAYANVYEALAKSENGYGWYESIVVKKKL